MTTKIKASEIKKYAGKGVKNRYRLVNDTFATTVGVDGCAKEEGWLPAGTIVVARGLASDLSPWSGSPRGNRPSGQVPVAVEGFPACELIPPDTEVEPVDG